MHLYWPKVQDWKQAVNDLGLKELLTPFHPDVLAFIQALSKRLIKIRNYPELVALGYWLRKAHIFEMEDSWREQTKGLLVKARGTVLHLAPSNVDSIFVYSWILSLLAGNRNMIRLSSKEQLQTNEMWTVLLELLMDPEYTSVAERSLLMTYHHNNDLTAYLSAHCHTRVIWGGDETVNTIRNISLAPMANEIVFPDRFSLAAINADKLINAEQEERQYLLQQFYNDSYWFDQMACSSPRLMVWIGKDENIAVAQQEFWKSFDQLVQNKEYGLMAATQMQKFTTGLWLAAEPESKSVKHGISFSRVSFDKVPAMVRERHCGGGLFYECTATTLQEISLLIVDKDQTLAYYGFEKWELVELASQISSRGIDRIVPIGQALNFDGVWDGQSFLRSFTREVVIL